MLAAATAIFHFANAPMLALASQKLALSHPGHEAALTSSAIIVAQLATVPVALLAGWANLLGRKPLLVSAFLRCPRVRCCLPMRTTLLGLLRDRSSTGSEAGCSTAAAARAGRHHAGHRPLQCEPWIYQHGPGHWGLREPCRRGHCGRQSRVRMGFPRVGGDRLSALVLVALAMPETRSRGEEPLPADTPQAHDP